MLPPQLAVVVPTRNRADLLARCLDSVREQTYRHVVGVVVDDASDDGTGQVLADYTRAWPALSVAVRMDRRGVNAARRLGTEIAPDGSVVVELDDDDTLVADALAAIAAAFAMPATGYVYGDCILAHPDGHEELEVKPDYTPGLFRRTKCWSRGVRAYRKDLSDRVGGWRDHEFPAGDYAFALRCELALGDTGLVRVPGPLARVRWRAGGISDRHASEQQAAAHRYRALARTGRLAVSGQQSAISFRVPDPGSGADR